MKNTMKNNMKGVAVAIGFILLSGAGLVQPPDAAHAMLAPGSDASFNESFLGGRTDRNHFDVWQGWRSEFSFNLTGTGGAATLFNGTGNPLASIKPTSDGTGFDPSHYWIKSAKLGLTISSRDLARDTVKIRSGVDDGNQLLLEETYSLGNLRTALTGQRKYADLTIDLLAPGIGPYLEDGYFVALVMAPDASSLLLNDFRIDSATMMVTATYHHPLPAAFWLFASGLAGLAGMRAIRRRGSPKANGTDSM